jgi:hypothetical protein
MLGTGSIFEPLGTAWGRYALVTWSVALYAYAVSVS